MDKPEKIAEDQWVATSKGVDSINFQRSAHMTWISVLMAMVVVILADRTYAILSHGFSQIRWYLLLYVIASGMIVVQSWVQYTWLTLVTHTPIQPIRTGLALANGITIYIICLSIENPANWYRAVSFFVILTMFALLYGLSLRMITGLLAKSVYKLIAVLGVCAGITLLASWHLTVNPRPPIAWLWGGIAVGLLTLYLWLQSRGMAEAKRQNNIP